MNREAVCSLLLELGEAVQSEIRRILGEVPLAERIRVDRHSGSDVIYHIDIAIEKLIVGCFEARAEQLGGVVLVAEGIGDEEITRYPSGQSEDHAAWRILMDPIDGTRGIMYDKRSAFFLAGAAPNRGPQTRLQDIEIAVMAECTTSRSGAADLLWANRGSGAQACTKDLASGARKYWRPEPTDASTIRGGFAQVSRFFPPGRELLADLEEELLRRLFPDRGEGEILCFEDQYIASGGQLYELLTGKDRFTADLRNTLYQSAAFSGKRKGHVCHPYDLAAHLIGCEAGLVLTNADGTILDAPMETRTGSDWIGYGNARIQQEVEPVLSALLRERKWLAE